jgi:hypothetical protein
MLQEATMTYYIVPFNAESSDGAALEGQACIAGDLAENVILLQRRLESDGLARILVGNSEELRSIQFKQNLTASIASLVRSITHDNPVTYAILERGKIETHSKVLWQPSLPALLVFNCIYSPAAYQKICSLNIGYVTVTSFFDRWLNINLPSTICVPVSSWNSDLLDVVILTTSHYFVSPLPKDLAESATPTVIDLVAVPGGSLIDPFEPEASKLLLDPIQYEESSEMNYTVSELFNDTIHPIGSWYVKLDFLKLATNIDKADMIGSGKLLSTACRCAIQQIYKMGRNFSAISPQASLKVGIPVFGEGSDMFSLEERCIPYVLNAVKRGILKFPDQLEYIHVRIIATAFCFAVHGNLLDDASERWEELLSTPSKEGMTLESLASLFLSEYMRNT